VTGGEKEIADQNEEQAQAELPIQPMKMLVFLVSKINKISQFCSQLSKETWFDMLEFVGRHQLGQLVPQIGDRQLAGIVQSFLHNYGRITLGNVCISHPWHRLIEHVVGMPENVKDFRVISLRFAFYRYIFSKMTC
jgi:hypothetical protein